MTEQGESSEAKITSEEVGGCRCSCDGRRRRSCIGRGEGRLPVGQGLHRAGARRLSAVGLSSSTSSKG
jgi:hypothetical protein